MPLMRLFTLGISSASSVLRSLIQSYECGRHQQYRPNPNDFITSQQHPICSKNVNFNRKLSGINSMQNIAFPGVFRLACSLSMCPGICQSWATFFRGFLSFSYVQKFLLIQNPFCPANTCSFIHALRSNVRYKETFRTTRNEVKKFYKLLPSFIVSKIPSFFLHGFSNFP